MRHLYILGLCGIATACAPAGSHYGRWNEGPVAAFTLYPDDACQRPELRSGGALSWLNTRVGLPDGPTKTVIAVGALEGTPGPPGPSVTCHAVIIFADQSREAGTLRMTDPGNSAPLQVSWKPDPLPPTREEHRRPAPQTVPKMAQRNAPPSPASTPEIAPIEPNAVLFRNEADDLKLIQQLVVLVRGNGFLCDSVSAARPMLTTAGYVLGCNKFRYTYDIQDKGGRWVVTVR